MGNHDDGVPLLVQLIKKLHHFGIMPVILTSCWLIKEDNIGIEDQNGGDGHPLFLAIR